MMGIFGKATVLLCVAEAVLKHTMSHDHSHFSSFSFFLSLSTSPLKPRLLFEAVDLFGSCFGISRMWRKYLFRFVESCVLILLSTRKCLVDRRRRGRTTVDRSSAHVQ